MLTARAAFAHTGRPLEPHDLRRAWSWEPAELVALALAACLYARGTLALWHSSGTGCGVRRWEAASFAAGWTTLAIALVSPLHALGGVLFSAHMVQHELLMVVAAPLLVLGRPIVPSLWAMPRRWRRKSGRWARRAAVRGTWRAITAPAAAFALHFIAIWTWHAPGLYDLSLRSEFAHAIQHASFLGTALLFWWAIVQGGRRIGHGAAVLYLFATAVHTSLLGALLTFTSSLWYPAYGATTGPWGLMPLEDQQLAGLIMWIPGGIVYAGAALALFASWLRESDASGERNARQAAPAVTLSGGA
jgi:cytochrome c oxidase assembly factor CtaG